jgi:hypothetical protein
MSFHSQHQIGWDLLPRGFLTRNWRGLYESISYAEHPINETQTTLFLSGLVRLMWDAQLLYWKKHIDREETGTPTTTILNSKRRDVFQTKIRDLHLKKQDCLHGHQEQYFHEDVEAFLSHATNSQMKAYLHYYEPAIHDSIAAAKKLNTRPIFRFPGFTYRPLQHQLTNNTQINDRQGAQILRKHNRWRNTTSLLKTIKDYLTTPNIT